MKTIKMAVTQTAEDYDKAGIDSAVQLAQGKMQQLGLKDFEEVSLSFKIGATSASVSLVTLPEPATETAPEE